MRVGAGSHRKSRTLPQHAEGALLGKGVTPLRSRPLFAHVLSGSALLATSVLVGMVGHAYAADSVYECNQYNGGKQVVLEVNHNTGAISHYTGTTTAPIQTAINQAAGNTTQPSSAGSGAGDTVIVCHGTYTGNINIGLGNDNLTVRSEDGSGGVLIVGNGGGPVVSIDDRGLTFGGPAEGFTISMTSTSAGPFVGIQEGIQGAQATTNEDEQCTAGTASGCDAAAPAQVTINDQISDNVFTNFKVPSAAKVTSIELDNTINSTVQQNLFKNLIPSHSGAATVAGIVVGTFDQAPPPGANPNDYATGDSSNINTAILQNALTNVVQSNSSTCTAVNGIELDAFLLDATVYNNLEQPLMADNDLNCMVTGIFSDAYGSLENEQTGTLAPVNANIDDNLISQLAPSTDSPNATGILLQPTPSNAVPPPSSSGMTCVPQTGQSCNDGYPPASYTVVQNELQQVYKAVDDEAVIGANSYIRDNNFDSDAIGVQNGATPGPQNTALDATNNWWGCELSGTSGPPTTVGNNHGCAALISPPGDTSWAPAQSSRVEGAGQGAGQGAGNN